MADLEFPRMVYRVGGMVALEGGLYDYKIAKDQQDAAGWHLTIYEADQAANKPQDKPEPSGQQPNWQQPSGRPTRQELEAKAKALGLTWRKNATDAALRALVAGAQGQ